MFRAARILRSIPLVHESKNVFIKSLPVTPLGMNQYMIMCQSLNEAAIVDCGDDEPQRWIDEASADNMKITKLLQTHGHVDHVCGLKATKELLPDAPIHSHPDDYMIFKSAPAQGMMFGLKCPMPPGSDVDIVEGTVLKVGKLSVTCLHTPGHSPGHVSFHIAEEKVLISGDLIFQGSIGRTDFPGCSIEAMRDSLERIKTMDDDVIIMPGHMGLTSVGVEKATNPFLNGGI